MLTKKMEHCKIKYVSIKNKSQQLLINYSKPFSERQTAFDKTRSHVESEAAEEAERQELY